MRIAILGAGFTGLNAGLKLAQQGHQVTIFEKEDTVGGLAGGFKLPAWDWTLEKTYHHWFTNDSFVLSLARELNYPVVIKRPQTNVWVNKKALPFDSPIALLKFPYLPLVDRLRTGLVTLYLKLTSNYHQFEKYLALPWVRKYMGGNVTKLIWEPLFTGKFGKYKEDISLSWFWTRINKRTASLAYPEGGFLRFAERIAQEIENFGGQILLETAVISVQQNKSGVEVKTNQKTYSFEKLISTLPSPIFSKVVAGLPQNYIQQINGVNHLFAQNLILILKKPFMEKTYWLNITDQNFPFLVLAEHTNFMDSKYYNNEHILYIGNYLPSDHHYLKMSADQLLTVFDPYLKKINPSYQQSLISSHLSNSPYAQPIASVGYQKLIPDFPTPLKNIYLANMDMVYPWDRGTNYAIEMGQRVAQIINPD